MKKNDEKRRDSNRESRTSDHTTLRPESPLNRATPCSACNGTGKIEDYGEGTECAGCNGMGFFLTNPTPPETIQPGAVSDDVQPIK